MFEFRELSWGRNGWGQDGLGSDGVEVNLHVCTHIRLHNIDRPPLQIGPEIIAGEEPLAERDGRACLAGEVCDFEGVGWEEGFCFCLGGGECQSQNSSQRRKSGV